MLNPAGALERAQRQLAPGTRPPHLLHRPPGRVQNLRLEPGVVDPLHARDRPLQEHKRVGRLAHLQIRTRRQRQQPSLTPHVSSALR